MSTFTSVTAITGGDITAIIVGTTAIMGTMVMDTVTAMDMVTAITEGDAGATEY